MQSLLALVIYSLLSSITLGLSMISTAQSGVVIAQEEVPTGRLGSGESPPDAPGARTCVTQAGSCTVRSRESAPGDDCYCRSRSGKSYSGSIE
jgi:hypothetical protein